MPFDKLIEQKYMNLYSFNTENCFTSPINDHFVSVFDRMKRKENILAQK